MPVAITHCRSRDGIDAPAVTVETHLANGLPAFQIVGLPEAAVREARDRVRAAIQTSGLDFPTRRITVNLAPADLPKDGGRFDLAIAIGILVASGQVPEAAVAKREFVAELGLDGSIRSVGGAIPAALAARRETRTLVLARHDAEECRVLDDAALEIAHRLSQVVECLHGRDQFATAPDPLESLQIEAPESADLADVIGQQQARRALEIAAAGGHHLLMIGPPGSGKSMLAERLAGILPPLGNEAAVEVAAIHSIAGQPRAAGRFRERPFRSPHHTSSGIALVGGGGVPRPGEISLAHEGVLFLDELTEFPRRVLDVLREPLETGEIHIARAARHARYPARFQLIAAMNPCPQGFDCDLQAGCQCTTEQQRRHRSRISAPLLDRIDLSVGVLRVPPEQLHSPAAAEDSASVACRVHAARERQQRRQKRANATLGARDLEQHAPLAPETRRLLDQAATRFRLSARAYHRIWRVARSIADLDASDAIASGHVLEALAYRATDAWR